MGLQVFKEPFVGSYDGVTPATMLPPGSLVDGLNVRKVALGGGWKPRKGCTLYNPSNVLESGAAIKSLHQYSNPRNVSTDTDYHFIAQVNSKLVNLEGAIDAAPAYTGEAALGVAVGTTPGFSCVVGEDWVYADGSGIPVIYGGANPSCTGFLTSADATVDHPVIAADFTRIMTDGRDTLATLGKTANDGYLVCSSEKASGIKLDIVTANTSTTTTIKVYTWQSSGWVELTLATHGWVDGTLSGGKTHAVDTASITWTTSSSDTMRVFAGIMGYWYKVVPQAALTDGVTVRKCQVLRVASTITNKWDGTWNWAAGCRFFDSSETEYVDVFGNVSNDSTSQYLDISSAEDDGDDFIYIKTVEPAAGFGFGMVPDYQNTGAGCKVDLIQYWNGVSWATAGTGAALIDTTLNTGATISFSQSGSIFFDAAAITPVRRTLQGDSIPGFWYRVEWDADVGTDVRIFMILAATFPEALPTYDGCVEFKGRLFTWGDPEYPNRLRYSAYNRPDCFSGIDSRYTDTFGGMDKVICAIKFYNELIVFKKNSVWLLEGYSPQTFGTLRIADTIGLSSPKSAVVAEVGSPSMHKDEPLSIAIWQDTDGIYVLDGRKPRKASLPVNHYFDTEYTTAIAATSINDRQAFIDPLKNEYHFLLPAGELVYNYVTDEWYPPWEREIDLTTGVVLRGSDNRYYTYGASGAGWVMMLENDTADKTVGNADKAISHSVKTRAISALQKGGTTLRFNFRKVWAELKARASATTGTLTVEVFKNMATTGTEITTPEAMSIVASGVSITVPHLTTSQEGCSCFQLEFSLAAVDEEMEIWGIEYGLEVMGEIGT